jgi:hypothetical protein
MLYRNIFPELYIVSRQNYKLRSPIATSVLSSEVAQKLIIKAVYQSEHEQTLPFRRYAHLF